MSKPEYQRPIRLEIDLNQDIEKAFQNCINSFQGLETDSAMESGTSVMSSRVTKARFIYNLGVLDGLIGDKTMPGVNWEGGEYDEGNSEFKPFKYWASLVKWLKDVGFFKHIRKESTL